MERKVHTFCRICVASCGIEATVDDAANAVISIEPDRLNPYTWGDFCRKGKTAHEVVKHPNRITRPMKRVGDRYVETTYAEAISEIARRLNEIIDRYGPDAVGSYNGNPSGFTFTNATWYAGLLDAIGTKNRFFYGSVDQNGGHIVCEQLYGIEQVSLVPDIAECDFFLLLGMDPAVSKFNWMENNPRGWQRVLQRQQAGAHILVVDPRASASAQCADGHIAVLPGRDWAFLLALVKVILEEKLEHLSTTLPLAGVDDLRALVAEADLGDLARRCGVDVEVMRDVATRFARARRAMCVAHTGVSHNENGTLGEWLTHVLNLITDRTDRPGGRRFERGVIDIGKVLAMIAPSTTHYSRVRGLPAIVGHHAVAEIPDEINTSGPGQIKAMLIAFGNPVISGPDSHALDEALSKLDFLVSIDMVQRESHRHADWLIPGTHWLERGELSPVLASLQEVPFIQYGAQVVDKPEGVMEEWEFCEALAAAMGRNLFGKPGVNRFVALSKKLARWTGRPGLAVNPDWVVRAMLAVGGRVKYSRVMSAPHGLLYGPRRYGDLAASLRTPDKRVRIAPEAFVEATRQALQHPPAESDEYPLLFANKRTRESMNSWLNESPGLTALRENSVEIHPVDAAELGIRDGDSVRVTSKVNQLELTAVVTTAMRPGVVCSPHGWGGRHFDPHTGTSVAQLGTNRNLLVGSQQLDPLSQLPAFNSTAVRVDRIAADDVETGREQPR
jgi:formate dehydrogenase